MDVCNKHIQQGAQQCLQSPSVMREGGAAKQCCAGCDCNFDVAPLTGVRAQVMALLGPEVWVSDGFGQLPRFDASNSLRHSPAFAS